MESVFLKGWPGGMLRGAHITGTMNLFLHLTRGDSVTKRDGPGEDRWKGTKRKGTSRERGGRKEHARGVRRRARERRLGYDGATSAGCNNLEHLPSGSRMLLHPGEQGGRIRRRPGPILALVTYSNEHGRVRGTRPGPVLTSPRTMDLRPDRIDFQPVSGWDCCSRDTR